MLRRGSSSLVQSHRRFLRKVILGAQEVHAQPLPEIELAVARRAESQVGDFPARVSPPAWKATWPAQNKPTRPSIFSLIHNSYQGEFLIRTWQLLTIHVHAHMIYLTKPLEFISACSHSTCTMHMPALSTAIMNHCMLLRTNRQDAARSKPSITHELLPIKDKMLPRRPPAKESAAEGLPEDIATYGATPARAMHSDNYTGACIDTHETFSCRAMQTPSLDN